MQRLYLSQDLPKVLDSPFTCKIAKFGQKIIVNHIKGCKDGANETVEMIKKLGGNDAIAIEADCSNLDHVVAMFDKAAEHYGKVDVLVNNAAWCCLDMQAKSTRSHHQHGKCVGQIGNPGQANYTASNGGVIGITKSCAKEFAPNIKVNGGHLPWLHQHMLIEWKEGTFLDNYKNVLFY